MSNMPYEHEMEFHGTRMTAELQRERVYLQEIRPFYLLQPRIFRDDYQWIVLYGKDLESGVAGYGDTPAKAAEQFDIEWLNQTVSQKKDDYANRENGSRC